MAILIPPTDVRTRIAVQKQNAKLTSNLTSDQLVYWNDGRLSSVSNLTSWIAGTTNEIDIADDGDGTVTVGLVNPLIVAKGGTGAASFTDHSILVGSDTDAFTAIGAASNGQIPIGSTGNDPVLATLTGGTEIDITNGAGSITITASDNRTFTLLDGGSSSSLPTDSLIFSSEININKQNLGIFIAAYGALRFTI